MNLKFTHLMIKKVYKNKTNNIKHLEWVKYENDEFFHLLNLIK
jgi:hypothetical protein